MEVVSKLFMNPTWRFGESKGAKGSKYFQSFESRYVALYVMQYIGGVHEMASKL